jgi:hypothetical protein
MSLTTARFKHVRRSKLEHQHGSAGVANASSSHTSNLNVSVCFNKPVDEVACSLQDVGPVQGDAARPFYRACITRNMYRSVPKMEPRFKNTLETETRC